MFSSAVVCLLAGLRKDYSASLRKIRWKGGARASEGTVIRFWW